MNVFAESLIENNESRVYVQCFVSDLAGRMVSRLSWPLWASEVKIVRGGYVDRFDDINSGDLRSLLLLFLSF